MTKYVNKPHGLTIGSDNVFFITGDGDLRSDYRAIVWTRNYDFDQMDSLNVRIQTPAQQLIWFRIEGTDETNYIDSFILSYWCRNWLVKNVGVIGNSWDVRSKIERTSEPIFFKRRTDALAFVRQIDARLKGIRLNID